MNAPKTEYEKKLFHAKRQLDAWIAENVMNYKWVAHYPDEEGEETAFRFLVSNEVYEKKEWFDESDGTERIPEEDYYMYVPNYCWSIKECKKILEKLRDQDGDYCEADITLGHGAWHCHIWNNQSKFRSLASAEHMETAITLAVKTFKLGLMTSTQLTDDYDKIVGGE